MQGFRIANLIMQSSYLAVHFLFILSLWRQRQPTPVWRWFFYLSIALWVWVSGRFMETIVYLYFPTNNDLYVFAANYQYTGNTTAAVVYMLWVFYLSGYDQLASNRWFRALVFACPVVICTTVFTNDYHHLFYTKLTMGEQVGHGPLFLPCVIWSCLILLMGYVVSIRFVLKTGHDQVKQVFMFSLFPILPSAGALLRSLIGIDRLDYTPVIMAIAISCVYQIIFRYHYVNIISASIKTVIEQTAHPIAIYDFDREELTYANQIAQQKYAEAARYFIPRLSVVKARLEGMFGGRHLVVDVTPLSKGKSILVTATDISDIAEQQASLDSQIAELEVVRHELEETNRNNDAYLDSLYGTEGLKHKQELILSAYDTIHGVLGQVEENLNTARQSAEKADAALEDNLRLTKNCIGVIREAVAQLREG